LDNGYELEKIKELKPQATHLYNFMNSKAQNAKSVGKASRLGLSKSQIYISWKSTEIGIEEFGEWTLATKMTKRI